MRHASPRRLAFVGIALTPENALMGWHLRFTFLGFYLLPAVGGFVTAAAYYSERAQGREVVGWATLTAVLVAYATLLA